MPAPTLTSQVGSTWNDTVNPPETTGTLSWNAGDRILVVGFTEDFTITLATPTATGLTFSDLGSPIVVSSSCWAHAWQATAGSAGSSAVTAAAATGTGTADRGLHAFAFGGCGGFTRTDGAGIDSAQTVSVTRGQANSFVVFLSADWSAAGIGGLGWTPAGQTQLQAAATANATAFCAYWGDQGAAGTTGYGSTGLAGTAFTKFAVEVLGTAGTADPGPVYAPWSQVPPGRVSPAGWWNAVRGASAPAGSAVTAAVTDGFGLADSVSAVSVHARAVTDLSGLIDATAAAVAHVRVVDDSAGLVDAATVALFSLIPRTVDDPMGITDTGDPLALDVAETVDDSAGLTDTAAVVSEHARAVTDPAGLVDTAIPNLTAGGTAFTRTLDDPAGVVDAATAASALARIQTDPAGLVDATAVVAAHARSVDDSDGLIDAASSQLAGVGARQADDALGLTDSLAIASTRTVVDAAGLVDSATNALAAARAVADATGLTDSVSTALVRLVVIADSAGLTDAATSLLSFGTAHTRTVTDAVGLTSSHRARCTTHRPSAGVTARPNVGTIARPSSGVTPRYPLIPD